MSAGACKGKTAFRSLSCRLSDWFLQKWMCQTCSSDNWKHNQPLGRHGKSAEYLCLWDVIWIVTTKHCAHTVESPEDWPWFFTKWCPHPTVHRMARLHLDVKLVCAFSPNLLLYQLESSREAEPIGWGQHWTVQVWTAEAHLYVDFFSIKTINMYWATEDPILVESEQS